MTTNARSRFLNAVKSRFGNIDTISRQQVIEICESMSMAMPMWLVNDKAYRAGRGLYRLDNGMVNAVSVDQAADSAVVNMAASSNVVPINQRSTTEVSLVPEKASGYVPFGNFDDVRQIVKSNKFYPIFITGLSGNGKTMMVDQVCTVENREMIRVNITIETDEDDLLGGFRLIDGHTVWQNGPVITAMEHGAILLLDEVDLGSNKLMCLQPVLEGKSVYLKKINKVISPKAGFNIIATANTKGKGSDDGRFIGTNVLNEAFLERFSITMEQEYAPAKSEEKILKNVLSTSGIEDNEFVGNLVQWADITRKTFYEGAVTEIISTRRLVHICEAYAIFGQDRMKAITLCLNRFDVDTKNSFLDLYKKIDVKVSPVDETAEVQPVSMSDKEMPF